MTRDSSPQGEPLDADTLHGPDDVGRVDAAIAKLLRDHPPELTDPETFLHAQYAAGLAWVHFPVGLGGLGLPRELQAHVFQRLDAAGAPNAQTPNRLAYAMGAPTVLRWGNREQQQHFLPSIFTGQRWCQLFSEPGAGSDLAAVGTRAVRDGDRWIVNGQKVWNSMADTAAIGMLLARTDPEVPKHRGLTYFALDMHAPGVEVRPLRQLTGEAEFSEVYLTDVQVPDDARLGPVGQGWQVAVSTLMNERTMFGTKSAEAGPAELAVALYRERGGSPAIRERVIDLWIRARVLRARNASTTATGDATPGPESSISKIAYAELNQRGYELCLELIGDDALLHASYAVDAPLPSPGSAGDARRLYLRSRANSIEGGTTEIMRNILGERLLGLPPEHRGDRDIPFSKVPRG